MRKIHVFFSQIVIKNFKAGCLSELSEDPKEIHIPGTCLPPTKPNLVMAVGRGGGGLGIYSQKAPRVIQMQAPIEKPVREHFQFPFQHESAPEPNPVAHL